MSSLRTVDLIWLAASAASVAVGGGGSRAHAGPPSAPAGAAPLQPRPPGHPHPVLVELFTSQGCSSCPAADEFVRELPRLGLGRDRVLPLTFHVDYWDGLGWKDPFAAAAFTQRQRDYAASGRLISPAGEDGLSGLYTPQMIVGGRVHFSGRRREIALAEIARAAAEDEPAVLTARATMGRDAARVTATLAPGDVRGSGQVTAPPHEASGWRLRVAVALKAARTAVAHGENGGETLAEAAIVRWLSPPNAIAPAGAPVTIEVPRPEGVAWTDVDVVAFVQDASTRRIVSARTATTDVVRP